MELMRLFYKLYSRMETKAPINIDFLLSGGGRLSYLGTRRWLQTASPEFVSNVQFALSLESLAGENVYLHLSKKPKEDNIQRLLQVFMWYKGLTDNRFCGRNRSGFMQQLMLIVLFS